MDKIELSMSFTKYVVQPTAYLSFTLHLLHLKMNLDNEYSLVLGVGDGVGGLIHPDNSAHTAHPEVAFYWAWQGGTEKRSLVSSVICVVNSDNVDL